jgi:hypothetical protein
MPDPQPYKVFVSSTFLDLKGHRAEVIKAVRAAGFFIDPMEDWPADAEEPRAFSQARVQDCDLCILLVARRRGHVPDGETLGITQMEYRAALGEGIDVLVFLLGDDEPWYANFDERTTDPEVQRWRAALARRHGAQPFGLHPGSVPIKDALLRWMAQRLAGSRPARFRPPWAPAAPARRPVGAEAVLPDLEPLLAGVRLPRRRLVDAYTRSAPPGWDPPAQTRAADFLLRAARDLARALPQSDGTCPLLGFVDLLAGQAADETARRLRAWRAEAARRLGAPAAAPGAAPGEMTPPCHLLVQVLPLPSGPGRYSAKAWLVGRGGPDCLLAGDQAHAREDLPPLLDGLRELLLGRGIPPQEVWVEFVLPRELLGEDLDQWTVTLDFLGPIPLGVEHRVSVRSLDRMRRQGAALALRTRWDALLARAEAPCEVGDAGARAACTALCISGAGGPALYARLTEAREVVCAVLGLPPQPAPPDPRSDALNTLFAAGVPVALWCRRAPPGGPSCLRALLASSPLIRLPDRVWELRKQASQTEDEAHPGRHLTLLWDDPTRVSPDFDPGYRLRPPRKKR